MDAMGQMCQLQLVILLSVVSPFATRCPVFRAGNSAGTLSQEKHRGGGAWLVNVQNKVPEYISNERG